MAWVAQRTWDSLNLQTNSSFAPSCTHFAGVLCSLGSDLIVSSDMPGVDVKRGWRLHSVGNETIGSRSSAVLRIPLRVLGAPVVHAAADASAEQDTAGLGGWWLMPGKALCASNILWFEIQLSRDMLPRWSGRQTIHPCRSAWRRWKRLCSSFWLCCSMTKAYASPHLWYACRSSVTTREFCLPLRRC